jgi:hypothetical protein
VVADFNGDGKQDIAVADNAGVEILMGNGDGTFQAVQTFAVGTGGVLTLAVGDFNGFGDPDLVVSSLTSGNVLMLDNGTQMFPGIVSSLDAPGASWLAVGDFNGDGITDIALTPTKGNGVFVLLGSGNLVFPQNSMSGYPTPGSSSSAVAIGDFNGDGIPDLAVANPSNNFGSPKVSVLLGNGDGTFQPAVNYAAGNNPYSIVFGDFDGDGYADLAVTSDTDLANPPGQNSLNVLLGNGDGTFRPPVSYPVTTGAQTSVAMGNFYGDGRVDLAIANVDGNTVSIYLGVSACDIDGDGATNVADVQLIVNEALEAIPAVDDLNGDGSVTVADVQIVIDAALGLGCAAK